MAKKVFTAKEFRANLEEMICGDRISLTNESNTNSWEMLDKLRQMSDEELLEAKLYGDLGLDSLDLWESVCMLERDYDVYISDEIDRDFGTGVNLTVAKYLEAVNNLQV